jgi:hypothetical protein
LYLSLSLVTSSSASSEHLPVPMPAPHHLPCTGMVDNATADLPDGVTSRPPSPPSLSS